ncbi:MAG: hypothetical protein K1X72_26145 [Pyrinomonadaceae bacterium]|nr:hypothetical protein [Pyrinomonadaceae bacterium]
MNGIFKIDKNFVNQIFERTKATIEDGLKFEKGKREAGFPSNEIFVKKLSERLSSDLIENLIETCFIASLEKEEGRLYNFSVSLNPSEEKEETIFRFENPIEFNSATLTKLAPAINPNYFSIDVWLNDENDLVILGFSEKKNNPKFTFATSSSGKIIVDCLIGLGNVFKVYVSMAKTGFISLKSHANPVADWLTKVLTKIEKLNFFERNSDLGDLLIHMFSHGNGGTILLIPKETNDWKNSIQQPVLYGGVDSFLDKRVFEKYQLIEKYTEEHFERIKQLVKSSGDNLFEILKSLKANAKADEPFENDLSLKIQNAKIAYSDIGGFTKIDGATVLTQNFEILAFGARIQPTNAEEKPEIIEVITPFENCEYNEIVISKIGGTRHQSAAQFVFDQKTSIAVVASHDGRLSALWWSEEKQRVIMMKHYEAMIQ